MKWVFCGAGIVLLAAILLLGYKKTNEKSSDDIDGGVVTYTSGNDAPKVIESSDITEFHCEFSLFAFTEPSEIDSGVYTMDVIRENETVHCTFKWRGRGSSSGKATFETDTAFLKALQEIVSKHDLAVHNGFVHTVSGLPDMFGAFLDIKYASGETIYAHDNQDCFLSMEAMCDLTALFKSKTGN